jgi:hypothetical protein
MSNREHNEQALPLGFVYTAEVLDENGNVTESQTVKNIIPQVGVNHIVGLIRGSTTTISSWYVGVYEGNYVPASGTTAANLQTDAQESVAYSEITRPEWQDVYDGTQLISNLANRAEFTFTATKRIYGGFISANSAKGSNTGVLLSIARFASPMDVPVGSVLRLGISITIIPAS